MMLMKNRGGDGNPSGSWKVTLRQAMLHHDIIFKNQVRELHRLYWTQKNLMKELSQTVGFSQTHKIGCRREISFNLQIGADEYIRGGSAAAVSTGIELAPGAEIAGPVDPSIGGETLLNGGGASLNARGVIDLEVIRENFGFKTPRDCIGDMCGSRPVIPSDSVLSSRTWIDTGLVIADKSLHADCSEIWQEHKPNNSDSGGIVTGLKDSACASSIDLSSQKKISTACKILHIDLNLEQNDEPFNPSIDSTITFPSPTTSSSVVQHGFLWREANRCSKETITSQTEYTNPSSSISGGKNADSLFPCSTQVSVPSVMLTENDEHQAINHPSPMSLCKLGEENEDSSSGQPHSSVHSDSRRQASVVTFSGGFDCNNQHVSVGSTNPPATVTLDSDDKRANFDGSEEDTVSSHAIPRDKDQHGVFLEEFPIVKKSTQANGNGDCNAVDKSQLKLEQQQTQAADMDSMAVAKAAEVLVSLTLEKSACPSVSFASIKQTELEVDQPQYSSDSFESITLKLSEIRDDGFTTPSRSTERATGKGECEVKLRRGRGRMRDFQRDVLPGLVSLSRHEIHEDLQTIGYEPRRNRSMQYRENWSVPVRSRRSRRYPLGQRR